MDNPIIEATYPISFRQETARELGKYIKNRQSMCLIGMKRVGMSNFLRFFLYHPKIIETYVDQNQKHLFIHIDLYTLSEKELLPLWILILKRIVEAVENFSSPPKLKKYLDGLFLESIASQDLFLVVENTRKGLQKIVENGIYPTIFFNRFDRILDIITPDFYSNLKGLREATHHHLVYIFTSFRTLDEAATEIFAPASLYEFCQNMFIKPGSVEDMKTILEAEKKRHGLEIPPNLENHLLEITDGHNQYLQLASIILRDNPALLQNKKELLLRLLQDERMIFQSEELWHNLTTQEQEILSKVSKGEAINKDDQKEGKYLWETGFLNEQGGKISIFNPLFENYLKQKRRTKLLNGNLDFTGKENLLFVFLKNHINEVCEREHIINTVWPEEEEVGVSDWAVDRLVARVRGKIKKQNLPYEVRTIKTRGYKLTSQT